MSNVPTFKACVVTEFEKYTAELFNIYAATLKTKYYYAYLFIYT